MKLFLCTSCNRHIKDHDEVCPFCKANTRGPLVADSSRVTPRMSRSALVVGASLGAAAALAMTNCSSAAYGGPFDASFPDVHAADVQQEAESSTDASDAAVDAPIDAADASSD
jgi:hypothetical protein